MSRAAYVYDAIYESIKDYDDESERLQARLASVCPHGQTLLDIACGTGQHLARLRQHYTVEGLDVDGDMLRLAGERLGPDVPLHLADMTDFDLGQQFDVITCLFSAIGYVRTVAKLRRAVAAMAAHLRPGGVLVVEPWLHPDGYDSGRIHATFVDQPDLKVARFNVSERQGCLSVLDFHYLIATPSGVDHFRERSALGLFTDDEYRRAFTAAGLRLDHDPEGLTGRGLYWGFRDDAPSDWL